MISIIQRRFGRAAGGAALVASGNFVEQGLRMARNMILARIVAPDAFGTFALTGAALATLDAFTQAGTRQAVIQDKDNPPQELINAAFYFGLLRGFLVFLLILVAAPFLAPAFGLSQEPMTIRFVALVFLFNCIGSPASILQEKSLAYGRQVSSTLLATTLGTAVAISLAFHYPTVWALLFGLLAESVLKLGLSYVFFPFKPKIGIDKKSWSSLAAYSKGMWGLPIITMAFLRADILILAHFLDKATVGKYALCLSLAAAPFSIPSLVSRVLLPVFARIRDDSASVAALFLKISRLYLHFSIPLFCILLSVGNTVLGLAYGSQYRDFGTILALQFLAQALYNWGVPNATVFMALGKPADYRRGAIYRAIIVYSVGIPAAYLFGPIGAAMASAIAALSCVTFQVQRLASILRVALRIQDSTLVQMTVGWSTMCAISLLLSRACLMSNLKSMWTTLAIFLIGAFFLRKTFIPYIKSLQRL
ncbi:oligosaccharide flippase family protein [Nibricoccus sp. IMCC34717]|uniref:oligosaccharide flippase family protein n=1 Tax=Nibricoccus sp. IMCC34717 TaxID=3034021 RepID=UPI00384EB577